MLKRRHDPIPCELIHGVDGGVYLRFASEYEADTAGHITNKQFPQVCCGGYMNGLEIIDPGEDWLAV